MFWLASDAQELTVPVMPAGWPPTPKVTVWVTVPVMLLPLESATDVAPLFSSSRHQATGESAATTEL